MENVTNALFESKDINIFAVRLERSSWRILRSCCERSSNSDFTNFIVENFGLSPSDFGIIGHSIVAHVGGCAGDHLSGNIDFVIGLDPAEPLFSLDETCNRLYPDDAIYVKVIHTNGAYLGFQSSIGDVDFFPNGGDTRNGCGVDFGGGCSHERAINFFVESIKTGKFTARKCCKLA